MSQIKNITLNGEPRQTTAATIADLVRELELEPAKVAVECNREIAPRSTLEQTSLSDGDVLEIVHFVGGGSQAAGDTWTVAGRTFKSRLIVGTGKYKDFEQNAAAVEAAGAEIVTVAVRRVNVSDPKAPMLTDYIDPKKITYLPNTAGCFTADDAIRTLRLAREAGGWDLVKLEVLGEARTLYPNMKETLEATEVLAKEGFLPMVYCVDDPIAFDGSASSTVDTWLWNFGDGNTSSLQSPVYSYILPGTYTISLVTTSPEGCTDTSYVQKIIDADYKKNYDKLTPPELIFKKGGRYIKIIRKDKVGTSSSVHAFVLVRQQLL